MSDFSKDKRLNPFIVVRLMMVPVLWWLVLTGRGQFAGVLLIPTLLTDWLDGVLARRDVRYADPWLDGAADKILAISVVAWVLILQPLILHAYWPILANLMGLWLLFLGLSLIRLGTLSDLHLVSGKIGGILQAIFVLFTLISGQFYPLLFWFAALSFGIAILEEMLILLIKKDPDSSIRGLWDI